MQKLVKCACAIDQGRPRCVQQLIADYVDAEVSNRRYVFPICDFVSLLRIGLRFGSSPGEHNNFGPSSGYLRFGNLLSAGNSHLAAAEGHQFTHPRWRAYSRIWPRLAIDTHSMFASPPLLFNF